MSVQSISKMGSLLDAVDNNMKTNLTFDDMLAITKNMAGSDLQMEKCKLKVQINVSVVFIITFKRKKRYFEKIK